MTQSTHFVFFTGDIQLTENDAKSFLDKSTSKAEKRGLEDCFEEVDCEDVDDDVEEPFFWR